MIILNKSNTRHQEKNGLRTWLLISRSATHNHAFSTCLVELDVQAKHVIHSHEPEQCYYIINGQGLVTVGAAKQVLRSGETVYIPAHAPHGIENIGEDILSYLTIGAPAFSLEYEETHWPLSPVVSPAKSNQ